MKPLTKTYKPGMHLFYEHDRSRELYIIQSGSVKVYRQIGAHEVELAILGKGAVLGEMALIDGKPRSASVKAIDDCSVVLIDAETFYTKIQGVPSWFISIIKMTSQKIRQANTRLQAINSEHPGANIVLLLSYQFGRFDTGAGLDYPQTKQQLIQLLGATHQRIVKILELLDRLELIELAGDTIRLRQKEKLNEFCTFLRLHIRKAFEKTTPMAENISKVVSEVTLENPGIVKAREPMTLISGESFWENLSKIDSCDQCRGIVATLRDLEMLSVQKKDSSAEGSGPNPLAGATLRIVNETWYHYYLFNIFNSTIESL